MAKPWVTNSKNSHHKYMLLISYFSTTYISSAVTNFTKPLGLSYYKETHSHASYSLTFDPPLAYSRLHLLLHNTLTHAYIGCGAVLVIVQFQSYILYLLAIETFWSSNPGVFIGYLLSPLIPCVNVNNFKSRTSSAMNNNQQAAALLPKMLL